MDGHLETRWGFGKECGPTGIYHPKEVIEAICECCRSFPAEVYCRWNVEF